MPAGLNHCQKLKRRLQSPASLGYIQEVAPVCNPHWSYWHLLSPFPVEKKLPLLPPLPFLSRRAHISLALRAA